MNEDSRHTDPPEDGFPNEARDTLPPGELDDPATLLASVAIQLDGVSRSLASVARDLSFVMGQTKSQGKTLAVHEEKIAKLEFDMNELKRAVGDLVGDGR